LKNFLFIFKFLERNDRGKIEVKKVKTIAKRGKGNLNRLLGRYYWRKVVEDQYNFLKGRNMVFRLIHIQVPAQYAMMRQPIYINK
jgi:hypothetical protein